ncbi:gluconeogenesis factor YvcK family protein [Desulfosporosinus nitroreducens]|uniref:Putative gluconeogenesis factor n=1 Tax=Desulfosporosinus nitroreducens TaxID=2018668 RepID=A0ABT8QLD0_9FIRM|nr:gluconeogenesis factor YvcK family protein [Desulfosporosinus nitroreducens]MCO1601570.1 YvcK family protein [Desulfosporosinus nitroreducens]MDO0822065.1 YvcK family protein [Desulfosporosinus nitroreducens]
MNPKRYEPFYRYLKWLYPDLKVKRWFILAVLGIFLFATGFSVMNDGVAIGYAELQFREVIYRLTGSTKHIAVPTGAIISALGIFAIIVGFKRMLYSIISSVLPENEVRIVDRIYSRHHLKRGPKIVVVGGGTGLSALLRGLKEYTCNLTAIVTVSDDGGSSGKLRDELGIQPPGDVRNCMVALAETEEIMDTLFSYRFESGALEGHSLGNLLLAGLTDTFGDFQKGIEQVGKVFALRGKVFPTTLDQVVLMADLEDGTRVVGETSIRVTEGKIKRVYLEPSDCTPLPEAIQAIEEADLIVLGPGSLYTSVLPNLLVLGLREKIREASAPCVYVCNVMTEKGETDGYKVSDHLQAILDHCGAGFVDAVLASRGEITAPLLKRYSKEEAVPVVTDPKMVQHLGAKYFEANLVQERNVVRHDSDRLAKELIRLLFRLKPIGERIALVDAYLLTRKLRKNS